MNNPSPSRFRPVLYTMLLVLLVSLPALASGAPGEPLTGPNQGEPVSLALNYLRSQLNELGLSHQDIADLRPADHIIRVDGLTRLYWNQYHQGLPIHGASLAIHLDQDGRILALHNQLVSGLQGTGPNPSPRLLPKEAIEAAGHQLGLQERGPVLQQQEPVGPAARGRFSAPGFSLDEVPVELRWAILPKHQLTLAWRLLLRTPDDQHWYDLTVDAATGMILDKADWVVQDLWPHPKPQPKNTTSVFSSSSTQSQSPTAKIPGDSTLPVPMSPDSYRVYAAPVIDPEHGSRSLVTDPADATASPFGWHDTNGVSGAEYTITRGNNAHAYQDSNANNSSSGDEPDGGASLDFDYSINFSQEPVAYMEAAVTNLFYWNNLIHDVFYHHGFTEASGNFQENNYGNGGLGSDYVYAEAQDGSSLNNANFSTPADGSNGRMQMFLWDPSRPTVTVTAPGSIVGDYQAGGAEFGSSLTVAGITGSVVLADDGTPVNSNACEALTNGGGIVGNIALIDRGTCPFVDKVKNAQNAGAIAAIVLNNNPGEGILSMGGTDGTITIPAVFLSYEDGQTLRAELGNGLTANLNNPFANDPQRDGDFDNGIIVHEYGHGISTRLTGGPSNSGCLQTNQSGGMGEGWGDFWALVMTAEVSDQGSDPIGIGTYPTWEGINGTGIRPYPYSTSFAVNPHTYEDIDSVSIPHGIGSIWANMIWQMYWNLVDVYGFDADLINGSGGNIMALDLVNQGLALQSCSPTLVQARDAILLADTNLNAGANQCLIWQAFAKRGLGFSATDGGGSSSVVVTEAYDLPPSCSLSISTSINLGSVEAGNTITYTLDVTNNTGEDLTGVLVSNTFSSELNYVAGSASNSGSISGVVVTWPAFSLLDGATTQRTFQADVPGNFGGTTPIFTENFNSPPANWSTTIVAGATDWAQGSTNTHSAPLAFRGADIGSVTEFHLTLDTPVALTGSAVLRFWHDVNTESGYDGGVVELSTNGTTWVDAGSRFTANGYTGALDTCCSNPLGGRSAFTGNSSGYMESAINLADFAGQNIQVRFIMSSDSGVSGVAWDVDDLTIQAESNLTNFASVTSDQGHSGTDTLMTPVGFGTDSDSDGWANLGDCAINDDTIWSSPGPASNLMFSNNQSLSWNAPTDTGGDTVVYDLIRSTDPNNFSTGICAENSGPDTSGIIPQTPGVGQVYYILVAPANGCGNSLGLDSNGAARSSTSPCT